MNFKRNKYFSADRNTLSQILIFEMKLLSLSLSLLHVRYMSYVHMTCYMSDSILILKYKNIEELLRSLISPSPVFNLYINLSVKFESISFHNEEKTFSLIHVS